MADLTGDELVERERFRFQLGTAREALKAAVAIGVPRRDMLYHRQIYRFVNECYEALRVIDEENRAAAGSSR